MYNNLWYLSMLTAKMWRKMDETDLMGFAGIEGTGYITEYKMGNRDMLAVMDCPKDAADETVIEVYDPADSSGMPKMRFTIRMDKF